MGSCLLRSFPFPHSVHVKVCFSYVAVPSSYSPIVGEWSTVMAPRVEGRAPWEHHPHPLSSLFSLPATVLDYVLDGDTDRRLRGQAPRVTFPGRGPDDLKHQSSGTVSLKHQHDRVCGDTVFQLQVATDFWSLHFCSTPAPRCKLWVPRG